MMCSYLGLSPGPFFFIKALRVSATGLCALGLARGQRKNEPESADAPAPREQSHHLYRWYESFFFLLQMTLLLSWVRPGFQQGSCWYLASDSFFMILSSLFVEVVFIFCCNIFILDLLFIYQEICLLGRETDFAKMPLFHRTTAHNYCTEFNWKYYYIGCNS